MKRTTLTALLLLLAMTALTLVSCGGGGSPDTTAPAATAEATTAEVVDDTPKLDVEKADYAGKSFTVLATVHAAYEFGTEEQTGDVVDDAVYERNISVEDYLNADLKFVYENGLWGDKDKFCGKIKNSVMAGDGSFDLVSGITVVTMPIAGEGYFIDANSLPALDFTKPWWIADMYERFSIDGLLFGFIGDAVLSMYKDLSVVFFNHGILNDYKLASPYDAVRDGAWTLDRFIEYAKTVKEDLDGDGKMSYDKDRIGFLGERVPCGTLQTAMELNVIDFDDSGKPMFKGLTEKYVGAYEKAYDFYMNSDTAFTLSTIDDQTFTTAKTFNNGNVFMMINFVYSTEQLREMEQDYGIIPMPKYDEAQENYYAQLGTSTSMLFVPTTTSDQKLASEIIECMSYYSYKLVSPKYFEVALKEKYARDADMKEMLDIIRAGATIGFEYVYGTTTQSTPNSYFRMNPQMPQDIASDFAAKEKTFLTSLDALVAQYAALAEK